MIKPALSRSSDLATLNDDEIKRIMSVLERDFKLRQKEWKRIEELKRIIRQEQQRVAASKEWHGQRCNRCGKPFRRFFDPKERCATCQLCVCRDCAVRVKHTKTWTCKTCVRLKELEHLTGQWFYQEIAKKYKRCGSAKIVRELCKREKELADVAEQDEDLGYGTLVPRHSTDSSSTVSYVIHDRSIRSELHEYAKRLALLIESLKSDVTDGKTNDSQLSIRDKESHKNLQQQITAEISRVRTDLSGSLRRSNAQLNQTYEDDLRGLLIQKTEQVLQTNLSSVEKNSLVQSSNFDQQLTQIIFDKYALAIDSVSISSKVQPQLTPSASLTSDTPSFRSTNASQTVTVSEKNSSSAPSDTKEDNDDDDDDMTPTESSVGDDKSDSLASKHRFIDTDPETMKKSTQRVDDWRISFPRIETGSIPSSDDDDVQVEFSTWL